MTDPVGKAMPLDHWSQTHDRLKRSVLAITITGESYRGVKARKLASKKKDA